ncbi:hypothetical protein [Plebeiibacterium sediminum]|uniref:Uncharacterized protein n=1 Tax=Plebeiibacterium sediminum TaxID=2992112 RepID=A0AAE3M3U1_9BACT|nr:hypothetical protein [Plebeiobacterium sediminum]MCW3786471.1 hypothetical protein [Plebeiobacterium sediminum]
MENIKINASSNKEEAIAELSIFFAPYAKELLNSGADFSYMNMYADNFRDELLNSTNFNEEEIFEILNEACDKCWKSQI